MDAPKSPLEPPETTTLIAMVSKSGDANVFAFMARFPRPSGRNLIVQMTMPAGRRFELNGMDSPEAVKMRDELVRRLQEYDDAAAIRMTNWTSVLAAICGLCDRFNKGRLVFDAPARLQ